MERKNLKKVRERIEKELLEKGDYTTLRKFKIAWAKQDAKGDAKKAREVIREEIEEVKEKEEEKEIVKHIEENMIEIKDRIDQISSEEIAQAIVKAGGWLSVAAKELGISTTSLKERIQKTKWLQEVLKNTKEAILDTVEQVLFRRIVDKEDGVAAMFWLKCQGQERGWIDRPTGGSKDKTIVLKVVPVSPGGKELTVKSRVKSIPVSVGDESKSESN